jgi:hypothetical protein
MKFLNKFFLVALVLSIAACGNDPLELDLLDNPNAVTPDRASLEDLYNGVQLNFGGFYQGMWFYTAGMSRMVAATGAYDYQSAYSPQSFNGTWNNAYAGLLPDVDALVELAESRGLDLHAGSAKVLKAYTIVALVDIFGNVPNSQALQGTDVISPTADNGADVYAAAEALLDEAIAQMSGGNTAAPAADLFYGGNAANWIKAAKSLKLKMAVSTRLVDGSGTGKVNALVSEGDIIDDVSEDWQANTGSQRSNPDSRHPFYPNHYESGDGDYMSNYYMYMLRADKKDEAGNAIIDPRIRYYFYRQVNDAVNRDVNEYSCHFSNTPDQSQKPSHYESLSGDPNLPYCVASEDGYFGRDHLNNEGIPPDGPVRTVYGLYPGGGQFDDESFGTAQQQGTTGAMGLGIFPLLMSSYVDFYRAEAALTMGTNDDPRAMLQQGIEHSMEKVKSFGSRVASTLAAQIDVRGELFTVEELYAINDDRVQEYVDHVLGKYDAAASDDERLDIIIREFYIAAWGNGLEAYNMYRRTGKPGNMAPSLEPNPGPFIRSFFLPSDHVELNQNANQKNLTDQVFWDNNPADFVY